MERTSLVSVSLFSSAQGTEVFGGLWDNVAAKLHGDASGWSTTDGHIKVNFSSPA